MTVVFPAPSSMHTAQPQASMTAQAALKGVVSVRLGLQQPSAAALLWRLDSAAAADGGAPRCVLLECKHPATAAAQFAESALP